MNSHILKWVLALPLVAIGIGGAWADRFGQSNGRDERSVSGSVRDGVIRDNSTPRIIQYQRDDRQDNNRDHHRDHDRDKGRRHDGNAGRPAVVIGVPVVVGPQYYPYPPSDYVDPVYNGQDGNFWYYCPDIGYYPDVQNCPNGWLRVIPNTQ